MPVESYEDDDEEQEGPRSSFGTYLAEGDALFKQSEYKKALESYSLALELQPNDKTCLVARSKCYLKLGDPQKALQDAEDALKEDKEFNKGLYRKAEALYCMGDFEYALMYYHRGHKLRPELDEFRLGIQKAQEAIDNSIGSAAKIKLENKGDLSFFTKQDDIGSKKRPGYLKPAATKKLKPLANRNKEVKPLAPSKKTVKQLLGELYSDKEYFEKLMEDEAFIKSPQNNPIYELVQGGLSYLETRTEFWRQQKPLYARKKEKAKYNVVRKKAKPSISKYVLKQLEEIDQALSGGDPDRSLRLAQKLLKSVEGMNKEDLPNKPEVVANIHSCVGNAYIELDQLVKALRHHEKDLQLSRQSKLVDGESRALDNVGRVHARMGNFKKAVDSWNLKLPLVKASLESTWLCHEIGRCHLELGNNQSAKEFGKKSLSAGKDCEDQVWQLNATVLIAQSEVKLGEVDEAIETFSNALELAIGLGDSAAQAAISKALSELQRRSSQGRRSQGSQGSGQQSSQSEDEGSPRIKSDLDKRLSDADVSAPVSRNSERSTVEDDRDDGSNDGSNEERTGDELESDAVYESNMEAEENDPGLHNNVTSGDDIVAENGLGDDDLQPPGEDDKEGDESRDDKTSDNNDGDHDVIPNDSNESVVEESDQKTAQEESKEEEVPEAVNGEAAGIEAEDADEGSHHVEGTQEIETGDVAKSGSYEDVSAAANEDGAEESSRDESKADETVASENEVESKPRDESEADVGSVDAAEVEGDVPVVAQLSTTHVSTNEVITMGDLDRQSSAEQLSVNPSYSEDVDDAISPVPSVANAELITESIDNVATPLVSTERLTSAITCTVSDTEVEVIPDAESAENVTETAETVPSDVSLPDTTTAADSIPHVESNEVVSSLEENAGNVSPTASVNNDDAEGDTTVEISEVSNAEEPTLDDTTAEISEVSNAEEPTLNDTTVELSEVSNVEEPTLNDTTVELSEASNAEEPTLNDTTVELSEASNAEDTMNDVSGVETTFENDVSSTDDVVPADSSQATLVSTADEIPHDASETSLISNVLDDVTQDIGGECTIETAGTTVEASATGEDTTEASTTEGEQSGHEQVPSDESEAKDESSSKETGDEGVSHDGVVSKPEVEAVGNENGESYDPPQDGPPKTQDEAAEDSIN